MVLFKKINYKNISRASLFWSVCYPIIHLFKWNFPEKFLSLLVGSVFYLGDHIKLFSASTFFLYYPTTSKVIWDKVFKSGLNTFCGRMSLENFNRYGLLKQTIFLETF